MCTSLKFLLCIYIQHLEYFLKQHKNKTAPVMGEMFYVVQKFTNNRQILREVREQSVYIWGQSFLESNRNKSKGSDIGSCLWVQGTDKVSISHNLLVQLQKYLYKYLRNIILLFFLLYNIVLVLPYINIMITLYVR